MGLIEQAAKRLEELKRAGISIPVASEPSAGSAVTAEADAAVSQQQTAQTRTELPSPFIDRSRAMEANAHAEQKAPSKRSKSVDVDLSRLASAGYVTPTAPRSRLADEMRVIKRPLLANAQGRSAAPIQAANLIMVTSALPGEGKSFMAINLAISIAMELDTTALLVDADVARPVIPERLGLPQGKGLLDLLTSRDLEVADVMLRTNIERLSILPAGTPHSRATELLASESMTNLLEDMASRYPDRVLVFDAPPLLSSTESRVLATHMGQIVLVVEADRTPQGTVKQALAAIEQCPVVMTVLNKIERAETGSYYYGYYGYGQ